MKIVADPNIAAVREHFGAFGTLDLVPGRQWTAALVRDADVLLVRSVTRVDDDLLEGSRVRFVGTATSGTDHIDQDALRRRGIVFAAAPGSNAEAVAEYVVAAVLVQLAQSERPPHGMSAGIIGCGQVGRRVGRKFEALGWRCLHNDPPLACATSDPRYVDLATALDADIVTLHVPLTDTGPFPTRHLLDRTHLRQLRPDVILINTARGGVVDEEALLATLDERPAMRTIIDCWEHEPQIRRALLSLAALGTAHIAGYSHDGRLRATAGLLAALCAHLGVDPPGPQQPTAADESGNGAYMVDTHVDEEAVRRAVLACYDIRADDGLLRFALTMDPEHMGPYFDALRRDYRCRREFPALTVIAHRRRARLIAMLQELGFTLRLLPVA